MPGTGLMQGILIIFTRNIVLANSIKSSNVKIRKIVKASEEGKAKINYAIWLLYNHSKLDSQRTFNDQSVTFTLM